MERKKFFKVSVNDALKISGIIIKIQMNLKEGRDESTIEPEEILLTLQKIENSLRQKEGCPMDPKRVIKILEENKKTPQLIKIDAE